jgi:hypothetical protein
MGNFFVKGHPNYYTGKKVNADDFEKAFNGYLHGELSQGKAAKVAGVSTPTFLKWCDMVFENGYTLYGLPFIKQETL